MSRKSSFSSSSVTPLHSPQALRAGLMPLGALAAGFGLAMPVLAQTPLTEGDAEETMLTPVSAKAKVEFEDKKNVQTVTTTVGRGTQEIRDIPQSLNVVTEKLIDDRKADTLNQALRLTAGVTFSAAENGTQQDTFIRGFSVAQVGDLLIDGMKDPSQYDRDTFNYDRIEVLRGSASMIFGRGSTGGIINQVNKKPLLADLKEVTGTVGTGEYFRTTGDFNMRTGEHSALRINGMFTQADNYGAEIDKKGLAPSFGFGLGTGDELNLGLFYLKVDNIPMSGTPYQIIQQFPNAVDPNDYYGAASDYLKGEARYGTVQHTHHFDGGGELHTQIRSGRYDRSQWYSTYRLPAGLTSVDGDTTITRVGLTPRKDKYTGTYLQSDYSNRFEWLGMNHVILTGLDAARETADRYVSSNGVGANYAKGTSTLGTPDDGYIAALSPVWSPSNDYVSKNAGIFIQDLVEFIPHWKLLAGLRWDTIDGTFNTTVGTGASAITATADMSDSVFSHRVGLLFQPTSTASFHLSYGTSFNTSGDTYQFASLGGFGTTPAQQAQSIYRNANTPPEKSRNFEIGAKLDWFDGNLSTRLAVFRTEKYNERTTDADFAGEAYLLSGKRHSQGWELEVAGRPLQDVEVYLSYAFIPTSNIDKAGSAATAQSTVGQPFGLLPQKSGSAWVTWQATQSFRMGIGMTGSSTNYSINGATPTRGARAPGYAILDALAEYYFTPDLYVQVNGSNLTDRLYGAELYRGFTVLGPGRNFKMTIGYTF
ncbi:MAG: TonB-dependent receptor [Steroidobacteraceae bacterium]